MIDGVGGRLLLAREDQSSSEREGEMEKAIERQRILLDHLRPFPSSSASDLSVSFFFWLTIWPARSDMLFFLCSFIIFNFFMLWLELDVGVVYVRIAVLVLIG